MHKTFFLFTFCIFAQAQECIGVSSLFSTKTKSYYTLPFILKRGEYQFPQKFYPDTPEQRKTNSDGEKLTLFCPVETTQTNLQEYCLIPLEDTISSCQKKIKPVLVKSKELEIRCGINGESTYYDFVFRDEISSIQTVDHLMYRICYNVKKKETIFTYHRVVSPNLLNEEFLQDERKTTYELDTENYELPKHIFTNMKTTFSNLNGKFTKRFKKNEGKFNDMKELFLVSPDHMAYSSWKIPVFHYINVKPAWDFTIKMWNRINLFFKTILQDVEFIQITGTKDVWESNGKTVYLDDFQTITIPKYLWKLVYIPISKQLSLVIVHNIPDSELKLPKLCEANIITNIHFSTHASPTYVYYCDPEIIADLYNLPNELQMLQKTEYFSPLVMSFSNGVYSFPTKFHGYKSLSNANNQVLFCPPLSDEAKIYNKDCLVRNEDENPYCMRPVEYAEEIDFHSLDPKCGTDLDNVGILSTNSFRKIAIKEKYVGEIMNICRTIGETVTIHKIISPQLLFNSNLENQRSIVYSVQNQFSNKNFNDYDILKTDHTREEFVSSDGEILSEYALVPPNDMAFSAWRKTTYDIFNIEFAWQKIQKVFTIINRQIEIQAAEENQEFIQMNGTLQSKSIDEDMKPRFRHVFHKHFWKVVYTSDMKNNIAIIVHNEKDKTKIGEKLCKESTCNMSQWNFGSVSDLEDFAYCCDAEVIIQTFKLPSAPGKLEIKNYHLPLMIKQDKNEDFHLAGTYNGYNNLEKNQLLFCPSEAEQELGSDEYNLFSIEKKIPYCKYPVIPLLIRAGSVADYCGGDVDAYEYAFNYKINIKYRSNKNTKPIYYLKVYVACFNHKKQETLYTYHSIKSTALLRNPKLEDERQMSFKISGTNSNSPTLKFTKLEENLYKTISILPYPEATYKLVPLFLVSPDDMGFAVWKRTAYHYINAKPSFEKVVEIWNSINAHITNLAMNVTSSYEQRNGFMDCLKIFGRIVTLNDGVTGIPNVFWKIIYSLDQFGFKDIVIFVHNVPEDGYISRKYCEENICKNKPELSFLAPENRTVYCCNATQLRMRFP